MRVDVVDEGLVFDAGVRESGLDRLHRAVAARVGSGDVVRVAGGAVAREFAVGFRAARLRVLLGFEDQHCRALAYHEPVAIGGEGTARLLGRIVEVRRKSLHLHEAADAELDDDGLGAARDNDVGPSRPYHVEGEAERVGRARAGRRDNLRRAFRAEGDRDVAGRLVRYQFGYRERRETVRAALEKRLERLSRDFYPSDAAAEKRPDAIHVGRFPGDEAGIVPRLAGDRHRVLREDSHVAHGLLVDVAVRESVFLESLDFRRDLRSAARRIELRYPSDAGRPGLESLP